MAFREFRYVVRKLFRAPLFAAVSVLTLALGIGANAAIFSVVHGVLLKPLPFDEPEALVGVWHTAPGLGFRDNVNQSPATYFTYREESTTFDDIGMWDNDFVSVTGIDEPERVDAMYVTDGTLPILRVRPALGRVFTKEDDSPGTPETVMLSHGYWQTRFGGDRGVLGRTLAINGRARAIVGVLPEGLRFLRHDPDVYLPFRFDRSEVYVGNFSFQALARLRPGATIEAAKTDVDRMIPLAVEKFPRGMTIENIRDAQFGGSIRPLKRDVVGDIGNVLWVLLGTVGLVLLIACANVANLFLVRADGRQQEIAIRTAMGAGRARLAREFLLESLALGSLGGVAGLALAVGGLRLLVAVGQDSLPRLHAVGIDGVVLAFTVAISLLAGFLFGVIPIIKYRAPNLITALKEGGRASSEGRERHRARNTLVVSQIALALVLLVGSGLMVRTFQSLRDVHPGFVQPEDVLTLKISIPEAEVEDEVQTAMTHQRILRRIEQIPGVQSVGLSSSITMDGWDSNDGIYVEGFPTPEGQIPPIRRFKWISENYFETMGNPVLAGRAITWQDIEALANVVVVTENFAAEYWSSPAETIGKRIRHDRDGAWREIVGVVGNIRDEGVTEKDTATIFWPMLVSNFWDNEVFARRTMGYAIRTSRLGSPGFMPEIRATVWEVNANLPIAGVRTVQEFLDDSMARTTFALIMLAIAAAVALLLGSIGIYGVISYVVSQRTKEIGVRMALGARERDVSRLVVSEGARLTVAGLMIGMGVTLVLTRWMSALLFGVSAIDPLTYGAVAVVLAAIALFASYLPARRAARVHPTEALRWE